MTLCIAAPCSDGGQPCIVFASDKRIETSVAGAEIGFKLDWAGMNWPAMYAGSVSSAEDLLTTYKGLTFSSQFTSENVFDSLRFPATVHKAKRCDHHIRMKLGISFAHFLEHGRQQLSDTQFREMEFEIRQLSLDCELIMAGFVGQRQYVFSLDPDGTLIHHDNFATIGSGSIIANSTLYQRAQGRFDTLDRTVYVVYEGMRLARIAPGVGVDIVMMIISHPDDDGNLPIRWLRAATYDWLEQQFNKHGPKPIDPSTIEAIPTNTLTPTLSKPKSGGVPPTSQSAGSS